MECTLKSIDYFFLTYFEALVVNGHLHILETPLFKVRNKKRLFTAIREEKNEAASVLKKGVEITRFKGLGEIPPNEFKQFISKDIRLLPVLIENLSDIKPTLEFYMGKIRRLEKTSSYKTW